MRLKKYKHKHTLGSNTSLPLRGEEREKITQKSIHNYGSRTLRKNHTKPHRGKNSKRQQQGPVLRTPGGGKGRQSATSKPSRDKTFFALSMKRKGKRASLITGRDVQGGRKSDRKRF